MCSQNQNEVEAVRKELLKAGIPSETRPHPVAEALGVTGLELWVQNERDFFDASKLYARLQGRPANAVEAPVARANAKALERSDPGPKSQAKPSSPRPKEVAHVDPSAVVPPRRLELKQASSLLQKGIEDMLLRESEMAGECASLRGKVEELTHSLAQAQGDIAREIKSREAAERNQAEQLGGLLNDHERERREWQQQLKSRDESIQNAQEQVDSISELLQSQQTAVMALRQEIASLQLQRDQLERSLADARREVAVERESRTVAEQQASLADEALQTQWVERLEWEQKLQAHVAGLGSLLGRLTPNATSGSVAS